MPAKPRHAVDVLLQLWHAGAQGAVISCPSAPLTELRNHGCLIEESPGRCELRRTGLGCYRELLEALAKHHRWHFGRRAVVYHKTTSTNDVCLRLSADENMDGAVVIADAQSHGRGRRGHTWIASPGQSILMSLLLRNVPAAGVDRLTLLAGLAAAEGIEAALGHRTLAHGVQIKWPNDLLLDGRKLGGILVERRGKHAVIGIGVNVAQSASDFPAELRTRATSLYAATGVQIDHFRVVVALLAALHSRRADLGEAGASAAATWLNDWKRRCPMLGQKITARALGARKSSTVTGRIEDVDPLHGLLVRNEAGALRWLSAQTTTLSPSD